MQTVGVGLSVIAFFAGDAALILPLSFVFQAGYHLFPLTCYHE